MNALLPFRSPLRAGALALAALLLAPPLQAERIVLDPPFTYTREDGGREVVQEIETARWRSRDLMRLWEQMEGGRHPEARTAIAMAYLLGDCLQETPAAATPPAQEPPPRALETPEPSPSPVLKARLGQASPKADVAPQMPEWMSLSPTPDGSLLVTDLKGRQVYLVGAGAPGDRKDRCLTLGGPDADCFPGKTPWPLSAVMASDGSIFIADGSLDHVVAISADRATVSKVAVGHRVLSLALDSADTLYLGTEAGLCRLDATSGDLRWLFQEYLPDGKDAGGGESKAREAVRCRPEHLLWNRDGSLWMVNRPSGPTGTILRLVFGAKQALDRLEVIGKGPIRQVARGAKDTVLVLLEGGRLISIASGSPYEAKGVQIETRQDLDPWFKRPGWALAAAPDGSVLLANPWAIRVLWPAKDASPLLVDQPGEGSWAPVWPFPTEGFLAWPAPAGTEEETKAK